MGKSRKERRARERAEREKNVSKLIASSTTIEEVFVNMETSGEVPNTPTEPQDTPTTLWDVDIDPNFDYLKEKTPPKKIEINIFADKEKAIQDKKQTPPAEVWRGAEWYQIVRLLSLPLLNTFYGGIRQSKITSGQPEMFAEFEVKDFTATTEKNIKELQIIEIVQIKKLLKYRPELVGLITADWMAIICELAQTVRHAVPNRHIMFRDKCYVMWIGSDMMTLRVIMTLTHMAITGDYVDKYIRDVTYSIFYRDREDRFGKNHQSQDLKSITQYGNVRLMQLPRPPMCGMTLDWRTFTNGKDKITQWGLPDAMLWPPRWVFEKYDTEGKFEGCWDGPPPVPEGYKEQLS